MAPEQKNPQQTIEVAKRNWQAEVETAQTYRDLAERERDEKRQGMLLRMAEAEERHAQRWEAKLKELGAEVPVYRDTIGRRLNRWWNKIAGAEIAIRRMEATEERQEAEFRDQAERAFAGEKDVQEFLRKSAIAGTDAAAVGWPTQFTAQMMGLAQCLESFLASPAPQIISSITF